MESRRACFQTVESFFSSPIRYGETSSSIVVHLLAGFQEHRLRESNIEPLLTDSLEVFRSGGGGRKISTRVERVSFPYECIKFAM